jgi:serine/threonine protein kinase
VGVPNEDRFAGKVIAGKYRIRRVVGAGSMGVVCEAEHVEIGKRLAIKLIDASLAGMNDIALRFRQEARAASLVESQHIVQVFDVGADDRLGLYLVMEYLTGEDLASLLAREKRIPADAAVRIAVQAARGLGKAHESGVVHRDLKPANIFLVEREDDDPLVKILDFGISKVIDASRADSKLKLTRAGMVVGTPQYMSPEQAQGYAVDARTDVWALGLVLYEMLAGRPAYPELPTYEQFIVHLVTHPPEPLRKVAPWVPEALAEVVHAAIEHDVSKRIAKCIDFARRLVEAHPITGTRASMLTALEPADTWADSSQRSPFADQLADTAEAPDRGVLTATATEMMEVAIPEDSIIVDIDVEPGEPPPPSATREAGPTLASSGIRGTAPEVAPAVDYQEDAPQFFKRQSLGSVSAEARPPRPPAPLVARPAPAVLPRLGRDASETTMPALRRRAAAALGDLQRQRVLWGAVGLAVLVVVVVVVVLVLALR